MKIEELEAYGADVKEGLSRCMGNEDFYLKMVNLGLSDLERFDRLKTMLLSNDLDSAFEEAHALKGVWGNLAITPVFEPLSELTELLRDRKEMDYMPLYEKVTGELDRLKELN